MLLLILNGGCASNSVQLQKDPKLVKRINEILDEIEKNAESEKFLWYPGGKIASDIYLFSHIIARETEVRFLIEHPDISLPLMYKRIGKLPTTSPSLNLYFLIFQYTKSAESIPYIADYFTSWKERTDEYDFKIGIVAYAVMAAEAITSLGEDIDQYYPYYFNHRLDIANRLKQWYKEYKEKQDKPLQLNRVNELLDRIDEEPVIFLRFFADYDKGGREKLIETCRCLIENPDIALPVMFKRLDAKKIPNVSLMVYFEIFGKIKSAESIPYIADYISSVGKEGVSPINIFAYALSAAREITLLKELQADNDRLFEQRLDITNKLRRLYEEYKKNQDKK